MLEICRAVFARFNLEVNMSAGKTEVAAYFVKKAAEIKSGLALDARDHGKGHPGVPLRDGAFLIVGTSY
eukprot:5479751-Amphidinium_carterae.1